MPHVVVEMDASDSRYRGPICRAPELLDWLTDLGVEPKNCRAFRVLADGDGTVEVTSYVRGSDGRIQNAGTKSNPAARMTTYTVPLSAPIPPLVLEHCRP